MSLLSLPVELVEQIVAITVWHGGFESIALSCQATYRVARASIPRYNHLVKTWRRVPVSSDPSLPEKTAIQILEAIVKDPDIAWFIEDLNLNRPDLQDDDANAGVNDEWVFKDQALLAKARNWVNTSVALRHAGQDPAKWMGAVDPIGENGLMPVFPPPWRQMWARDYKGELDHHYWRQFRTLFLLTLLPNLRTLQLPNTWSLNEDLRYPRSCRQLLVAMMQRIRENPDMCDLPLAKLQTGLPFQEIASQPSPRSSFGDVAPFLALPDIAEMVLTNIIALNDEQTLSGRPTDETGIPFLWPFSDLPSGLHTLVLKGCCVNAAALIEVLHHTPRLTSFAYTHDSKYRGLDGFHAGELITAIGKAVGKTLAVLMISFDDWSSPYARCIEGPLQDFVRLDTIRIHMNIIGERDLADILPRSVQKVALIGSSEECLELSPTLFRQHWFLRSKSVFPRLDSIHIQLWDVRDEEATEILRQDPPAELTAAQAIISYMSDAEIWDEASFPIAL